MRQIILDTETTGISHKNGHRIIEVGCIEVVERKATGKTFHYYLNPERAIDAGAFAVHGLSNEFLADKKKFMEISYDLWLFLQGAELVIHNASFDIGFLDAEFAKIKMPGGARYSALKDVCSVVDTLTMARKIHPGQANSLDALCKRYTVDSTQRDLHGALLDSELLLQVYLAMTGGQISLLAEANQTASAGARGAARRHAAANANLKIINATDFELDAHNSFVKNILKEN